MNYPVISFNAGELSPQIDARSDVDKYKSGCRRLENMIPKIYGSAERRPGTKYIDTVNGAGRVVSFIYSNSIAYILLLEDYAMYFYYNGARVLDSLGRRLKVDTPYAVGDLPALQFKQSNDVCWIVHPNYPPHKLSRVSANSFSLDAITFTNGPFKKRNDLEVGDGITLTPSVTTGSGTLTAAGGNVFQAGHVGALFRVVQPRAVTSTSGSRTTTGVIGAAILTEGDCTLNIEQGWAGTVRLERSIDAGVSWEVRRSYTSKDKFRAVQFTFTEEEDNIQHRINVTVATSGTFAADLTVNSSTQEGICRVTGVTGQVANMTVLKNFASTGADTRWSEGSWSAVRGYPTTVTFFEDRCIYAGNPHQPQTVWFSATGDYENMDEGTIDDSAFWLTMSSDHRNAILWISALEALIIGTSAGEWRIRSSDYDEPITPTNFSMKEQTTYGSKAIQALPVNDVILFVDSVGRKIREVAYVGDKDKYNAPDLTALAEHITETGIVAIAHQKNPDSILWAVRADGTLLSMTYEREQDVIAWARHLVSPSQADTGGDDSLTTPATQYKYTYINENGNLWGIPFNFETMTTGCLDVGGVARNVATDKTGLPYTGHPFAVGDSIKITGTTNYSSADYTLLSETTADELVISKTYIAETFDGTETVVKHITTHSGAGRMTQDSSGNIYIAHTWDTTHSTYVTRYNTDGTIEYNFLAPVPAWPVASTADVCMGTAITPDDQYIYVFVQEYSLNDYGTMHKFNLTTGAEIWRSTRVYGETSSGGYGMCIDEDGNAYARTGSPGQIRKFANADGAGSFLTLMGEKKAGASASASTAFPYVVKVDNSLGIVVSGGYTLGLLADQSYAYNLAVRTFDDSKGDQITLGGWYNYSGGFYETDVVDAENIVIYGGYIYVLMISEETGIRTIYKVQWDGTNLNVIASTTGPTYGVGIFVDLYGHIVVVNQYWTVGQSEIFYFYDLDLTYISQIGGYDTSMLIQWAASVGGAWSQGNVEFYPGIFLAEAGEAAETVSTVARMSSVAVIPSTDEDEIWLITGRFINGAQMQMLEQMQPRNFGDPEDAWFVDCGLSYDGAPEDTFVGLEHLEGREVCIVGDGAVFPRQSVEDGRIVLPNTVSKCIIGLPFRYVLKPMRFDILTQHGTTKGSLKKISEVVISFFETSLAKYGIDENNLFEIDWRTDEAYGEPPALFTGDVVVVHEGGFSVEDSIVISGDDPTPCTIRAIIPRIEITGR